MNDVLCLRGEVKQLHLLALQLEPFVKSFAACIGSGDVTSATSDSAGNQHLKNLLDHLSRLQMQDPHHQAAPPTKDNRYARDQMNTDIPFFRGRCKSQYILCIKKLVYKLY